jgi:Ca2+-binding EF-hand superfamily protein
VIPYGISKLYSEFVNSMKWIGATAEPNPEGVWAPDIFHYYVDFWQRDLFKLADKDNSNTLTEKEFIEMFEDNIKSFLDILDDNQNGGVETETEGKPFDSISYKILNKVLITVISFFDFDKNKALSLEDLLTRKDVNGFSRRDGNQDGRISLEEYFSTPPSDWFAPLYKFYTSLDLDLNEELSEEELIIFLRKTFRSFDKNNDCKVSSEEIATLVNNLGLPNYYGVGVKILLDDKLLLLNFIISSILKKADRDQDGQTTYEELMDIDDWDWLDEKANAFAWMTIYFPYGVVYKLMGEDLRGHMYSQLGSQENRDKFMKTLLDALDALLEQPPYQTQVTDSYCV